MKVYPSFTGDAPECGFATVVTLGTFDGVHAGHQRILDRVVTRAREDDVQSAVVTFDRHPVSVLNRSTFPGILTTLDEKLDRFANAGVDFAFVVKFTPEFARISADGFIRDYLSKCLGMRRFVVGYDHGFGRGRELSGEHLTEYAEELGFRLEVIDPVVIDGVTVKSSAIRVMIREGDVHTAALHLGRDYSMRGIVVHGSGIGRRIGIPTANLLVDDQEKLIPARGVYAGWALAGGECRPGVISVGPRPTFDEAGESIEIHLPGYDGDLYDRSIRVGFTRRLRDIVRFETQEALVRQIEKDIESAKQFTVSCSREKE